MQPFFTVEMPPLMGVMTALILAFVLGLGMAYIHSDKLKGMMDDFKLIIERVISKVIIPLLPFYIFGIFLSMTQSGQVSGILGIFLKLIEPEKRPCYPACCREGLCFSRRSREVQRHAVEGA